jgi:hypothetical protein
MDLTQIILLGFAAGGALGLGVYLFRELTTNEIPDDLEMFTTNVGRTALVAGIIFYSVLIFLGFVL